MSNNGKITQIVDAKSLDRLARVLGAFDENLNFLSRELHLLAYVEGVKIRLEGEAENVAIGANALNALLGLAAEQEEIDEGRIA